MKLEYLGLTFLTISLLLYIVSVIMKQDFLGICGVVGIALSSIITIWGFIGMD